MTTERERRGVFGEDAEAYEAARPGYPDELVTDVLAAAGPGPALEVGAGTGKATVAFAARGIDLTCIELDPRMADVLRRKVDRPGVTIVVGPFESWQSDRGYGLLYSAQAWHWIDPDRRVDLAHAALAPGGLLALFWNVSLLGDAVLHAALAEVDARHGLADHTAHRWTVADHPLEPGEFAQEWPELGLIDTRFTDLETRRYPWSQTYSSATYRRYLLTTSLYRLLAPGAREAVLRDTVETIDAHGGRIEVTVHTDLALARRR
jgi:SAM-dependent methyltransferase